MWQPAHAGAGRYGTPPWIQQNKTTVCTARTGGKLNIPQSDLRSDSVKNKVPQAIHHILNIQEASGYTGLSVHTLYTMVSQKRIPHIKLGRRVLFDKGLLDEWIAKNTIMPMPTKKWTES